MLMNNPRIFFIAILILVSLQLAIGQTQPTDDREVAARFAPVFYQALGDKPRSDYITNFDFDGDWRGDNNWDKIKIAPRTQSKTLPLSLLFLLVFMIFS